MTAHGWSFLLSWSRVGINALLFVIAARVLGLEALGLFAIAFAPIRLVQGLHKAGLVEAVVVFEAERRPALFTLSFLGGALLTVLFAVIGAVFSPLLLVLSVIPLCHGVGAVSEGILRKALAVRALALRTLAIQSGAAGLALSLLAAGAGPWALVAFAVTNAALTALVSLRLARWRPRIARKADLYAIWPVTASFLGRVLLTTSQFPLAQLVIGIVLGPTAAGAFQIATRMFDLIEAVTTSPLRYIALPDLSKTTNIRMALQRNLNAIALLGAWIWGGTAVAALPILSLAVGPTQASPAAPALQALCGLGLVTALTMPLTQALTAKGHLKLVLTREALALGLGLSLLLPALAMSLATGAAILSAAAFIANLWFTQKALTTLELPLSDLSSAAAPLCASAAMCGTLLVLPTLPLSLTIAVGTGLYGTMIAFMGLSRLGPFHTTQPAFLRSKPHPPRANQKRGTTGPLETHTQ